MPTLLLAKSAGRISDSTLIDVLRLLDGWTSLSSEQQQSLYALLPPINDPQTGQALPVDTSIHPAWHPVYGEAIKGILAYTKKHVEDGFDKKAWQDEALQASQQRAQGKYDASKEIEREQYWGQKSVPEYLKGHDGGHVKTASEE